MSKSVETTIGVCLLTWKQSSLGTKGDNNWMVKRDLKSQRAGNTEAARLGEVRLPRKAHIPPLLNELDLLVDC